MANSSISELVSLMNQQFDLHDQLALYLSRVQALSCTALLDDFPDPHRETLQDYFGTLYELIGKVQELHDTVHQMFVKARTLVI